MRQQELIFIGHTHTHRHTQHRDVTFLQSVIQVIDEWSESNKNMKEQMRAEKNYAAYQKKIKQCIQKQA